MIIELTGQKLEEIDKNLERYNLLLVVF